MITAHNRIGVGIALVLLAVALVLPRLLAKTAAYEKEAFREDRAEYAVEYARARLWDDFLVARHGQIPAPGGQSPSLSEYVRYLLGAGLSASGDVITLWATPTELTQQPFDELRVACESSALGVTLHVALVEHGHNVPVGSLRITPGSDGVLGCASRLAERPQLWALWPVMPQPLLP